MVSTERITQKNVESKSKKRLSPRKLEKQDLTPANREVKTTLFSFCFVGWKVSETEILVWLEN
jgi:hypothetical protein